MARGEDRQLLGLFDALPEFLHSANRLGASGLSGRPERASRAEVLIAMTQAHVALLRADDGEPDDWTQQELAVARYGFRWPIPVLAVSAPGTDPDGSGTARNADRTVAWNGIEIARAVQELTAAAQVERQAAIARLAGAAAQETASGLAAPSMAEARALPVAEITEALHRLREARARAPGKPGSV